MCRVGTTNSNQRELAFVPPRETVRESIPSYGLSISKIQSFVIISDFKINFKTFAYLIYSYFVFRLQVPTCLATVL